MLRVDWKVLIISSICNFVIREEYLDHLRNFSLNVWRPSFSNDDQVSCLVQQFFGVNEVVVVFVLENDVDVARILTRWTRYEVIKKESRSNRWPIKETDSLSKNIGHKMSRYVNV